MKDLDVCRWAFFAAQSVVFRRLASQMKESFNLIMKEIGVRYCSLVKMIRLFLRLLEWEIGRKIELASSLGDDVSSRVRKEIDQVTRKVPAMNKGESDVYQDEESV